MRVIFTDLGKSRISVTLKVMRACLDVELLVVQ